MSKMDFKKRPLLSAHRNLQKVVVDTTDSCPPGIDPALARLPADSILVLSSAVDSAHHHLHHCELRPALHRTDESGVHGMNLLSHQWPQIHTWSPSNGAEIQISLPAQLVKPARSTGNDTRIELSNPSRGWKAQGGLCPGLGGEGATVPVAGEGFELDR